MDASEGIFTEGNKGARIAPKIWKPSVSSLPSVKFFCDRGAARQKIFTEDSEGSKGLELDGRSWIRNSSLPSLSSVESEIIQTPRR
jgi:hypothetical protein